MFSRSNLYDYVLFNAAKFIGNVTRDKILIDQINTLTKIKNRVDHEEGKHDDLVIAWLMAKSGSQNPAPRSGQACDRRQYKSHGKVAQPRRENFVSRVKSLIPCLRGAGPPRPDNRLAAGAR